MNKMNFEPTTQTDEEINIAVNPDGGFTMDKLTTTTTTRVEVEEKLEVLHTYNVYERDPDDWYISVCRSAFNDRLLYDITNDTRVAFFEMKSFLKKHDERFSKEIHNFYIQDENNNSAHCYLVGGLLAVQLDGISATARECKTLIRRYIDTTYERRENENN